jgi:hypothetical protein
MAEEFWKSSPFGEDSIFHPSWEEKQKLARLERESQKNNTDEKQKVQYYVHPDKKQFQNQKEKAENQYNKTKSEYVEYYKKIGKITDNSTDAEVMNALSEANKEELQRLEDLKNKNQVLLNDAVAIESQWNKLDGHIENVVDDFNKLKVFKGNKRLNPSLLKALMFSESEMGAGVEYKKLIESVPKTNPNAVYQLNLGRVTDGNLYNAVVKEFKIPVNWKTNYKAMGNKNDVMLAAGALIQKMEYALQIKSSHFKSDLPWFNAIVAYKGVSSEGLKKANLVWKLFETGTHPYTIEKKLF